MERNQGQVKVQMSDITAIAEIEFERQFSEPLMLYLCLKAALLKSVTVWALERFLTVCNVKIWAATLEEL